MHCTAVLLVPLAGNCPHCPSPQIFHWQDDINKKVHTNKNIHTNSVHEYEVQ